MTRRSVPEWIGKTSDTPVPARVMLRVFERYDGVCHITERKILPGEKWDCDHKDAICNGGENRESNLRPALKQPHRDKTREDVAVKARDDRIRKKHLGIKTRSGPPMPGSRDSEWKHMVNKGWVKR